MIFLLAGIAMLIMKALDVSFMVDLSWWWCGAPFVMAFLYWEFVVPAFHLDAKREMRDEKKRVKARRQQQMDDLWSEDEKPKGFFRRKKKR